MKVELIEFYQDTQKKKNEITGTAHVYIEDFDLDVRGIYVRKTGNQLWISKPTQKYIDENQKSCKYPIIDFANRNTDREFIKHVRNELQKYFRKKKFTK